jgi:hypothetical protein
MYDAGAELSNSPRLPIKLGDVPAIQRVAEEDPSKKAYDYQEKPFHAHGSNLSMPTSIRRFWLKGAILLRHGSALTAVQRIPAPVMIAGAQLHPEMRWNILPCY